MQNTRQQQSLQSGKAANETLHVVVSFDQSVRSCTHTVRSDTRTVRYGFLSIFFFLKKEETQNARTCVWMHGHQFASHT